MEETRSERESETWKTAMTKPLFHQLPIFGIDKSPILVIDIWIWLVARPVFWLKQKIYLQLKMKKGNNITKETIAVMGICSQSGETPYTTQNLILVTSDFETGGHYKYKQFLGFN